MWYFRALLAVDGSQPHRQPHRPQKRGGSYQHISVSLDPRGVLPERPRPPTPLCCFSCPIAPPPTHAAASDAANGTAAAATTTSASATAANAAANAAATATAAATSAAGASDAAAARAANLNLALLPWPLTYQHYPCPF